MTVSRDTWLAAGLVLLLVLVTIAAALQQGISPGIPYLSTSDSPDGTLALNLYLGELGYNVIEETPPSYQVPQKTDLVLMLQPIIRISDSEWQVIDEWVKEGGTLILAEEPFISSALAHYDFRLILLDPAPAEFTSQTPLLTSPPMASAAPVGTDFYLGTERADFVTHLAVGDRPVLVSFDDGEGRVILSATPYPFSNLALKDDNNAALVLNLIALSVRSGNVWFDEWHHGLTSSSIVGPDQWLRATPLGHALLFLAGAIFFTLLLRGRSFGRPVPLPHEIKRRGPLEHVTAIANLSRKAGHRDSVLEQYHNRLKRHLGRRYRLDPYLADPEFVDLLAHYNPALDRTALLDLLHRLSRKNPGEAEMVRLASEASGWINEK